MKDDHYDSGLLVGACCYFCPFNDFGEVVGISYVGVAMPFPLSGEG